MLALRLATVVVGFSVSRPVSYGLPADSFGPPCKSEATGIRTRLRASLLDKPEMSTYEFSVARRVAYKSHTASCTAPRCSERALEAVLTASRGENTSLYLRPVSEGSNERAGQTGFSGIRRRMSVFRSVNSMQAPE